MTIDASIPLSVQSASPAAEDVTNTAQALGNIAIQGQHRQENEMNLQQHRYELEDKTAMRDFDPGKYTDQNGNTNYNQMYSDLYKVAPSQALSYVEKLAGANKGSTNAQADLLGLHKARLDKVNGLLGSFAYDDNASPAQVKRILSVAAPEFGMPKDQLDKTLATLPDNATPQEVQKWARSYQIQSQNTKDQIANYASQQKPNIQGVPTEMNPQLSNYGQPTGAPVQPTATTAIVGAAGQPQYTTEGQLNAQAQQGAAAGEPVPAGMSPIVAQHIKDMNDPEKGFVKQVNDLQPKYTQLQSLTEQLQHTIDKPPVGGPGSKASSIRDTLIKLAGSLGAHIDPNDSTVVQNSNAKAILGIDPSHTSDAEALQVANRLTQGINRNLYYAKAKANLGNAPTPEQVQKVSADFVNLDPRAFQIDSMSRKQINEFQKTLSDTEKQKIQQSLIYLKNIRAGNAPEALASPNEEIAPVKKSKEDAVLSKKIGPISNSDYSSNPAAAKKQNLSDIDRELSNKNLNKKQRDALTQERNSLSSLGQ